MLSKSEINNLSVFIFVDKNICWSDISVQYIMLFEIFKSWYYFSKYVIPIFSPWSRFKLVNGGTINIFHLKIACLYFREEIIVVYPYNVRMRDVEENDNLIDKSIVVFINVSVIFWNIFFDCKLDTCCFIEKQMCITRASSS